MIGGAAGLESGSSIIGSGSVAVSSVNSWVVSGAVVISSGSTLIETGDSTIGAACNIIVAVGSSNASGSDLKLSYGQGSSGGSIYMYYGINSGTASVIGDGQAYYFGSKGEKSDVIISSGSSGAVSMTSSKSTDSVAGSVTVAAGNSNAAVGAGAYFELETL